MGAANITMTSFEIAGGRVLMPDGALEAGSLSVVNGRIADADGAAPDRRWCADGLLVLPGMVDLHGDAFERQLMPRPGVHFDHAMALLDTDRQMIANGITTAYHGLTWSWEPGLRGRDAALAFRDGLEATRPVLACDTRLHLRWETHNIADLDEVAAWVAGGHVDLFAFNDHIGHIATKIGRPEALGDYTARTGLTADAFVDLFRSVAARRSDVPAAIERLAELARARGIPMASHDDETPDMRAGFDDLGCRLCEFPVDEETARHAIGNADPVILGAPNILRGGSHCGRLDAADAIAKGLCTVLTSDYYYPALLTAPFRLAAMGAARFADAWRLVSTNPARAVGLDDRGDLAPGRRADVILIDDSRPGLPRVVATLVAGRPVFQAEDLSR